jgi:hypothetical protein
MCLSIDGKQLRHLHRDSCRDNVLLIGFSRLDEASSGVRPTGGVHHLRSADTIVSRIGLSLQNACEVFQETHGPFAPAPYAELEDGCSARSSVLPQIAGVVPRPAIACLHIHRRLIGLDLSAADSLAAHDRGQWS